MSGGRAHCQEGEAILAPPDGWDWVFCARRALPLASSKVMSATMTRMRENIFMGGNWGLAEISTADNSLQEGRRTGE